jgi:hypothetical protein
LTETEIENAAHAARRSQDSFASLYFETDRRNIRSIFSLVASQQDWLACEAAKA